MTAESIASFPHLVDRMPTITGDEIAAELVPPRQFDDASFESYRPDSSFPSQSEALDVLKAFAGVDRATEGSRARGLFGRRQTRTTPAHTGVYLDGGFGVGKTHLLAALWHQTSGRKYFGTFIEYTALVGALGYAPAAKLLQGSQLICIDEFELDDPGDTMIMTRLLSQLVASGSRVAATSNTPPSALGEGRFAAVDFLREIQALSSHFVTVRIDGDDYRHRGVDARAHMTDETQLHDRIAERARAGESVTVDRFDDVVRYLATVHPSRYIKVLNGVDAIAWTDAHLVTDQSAALRLVAFVDRIYDAQIPLIASGHPLDNVFGEEMLTGGYRKKYLRALSRLVALTRPEYRPVRSLNRPETGGGVPWNKATPPSY